MHYTFDNQAVNKIWKFWKCPFSVHEWLIYQYRLQKSYIGRSLFKTIINGSFQSLLILHKNPENVMVYEPQMQSTLL